MARSTHPQAIRPLWAQAFVQKTLLPVRGSRIDEICRLYIIALSVRPFALNGSSPPKTVFSLPTALLHKARHVRFLPDRIPLHTINRRCFWPDCFHFLTPDPAPTKATTFTNSALFIRVFSNAAARPAQTAYLVWPARVGAFSTVIGSHYLHFDTSSMPFSYLLEEKGRTMLVPGTAIKGVGTVRDEQKWIGRDNRKDTPYARSYYL